MHEYSGTNDKDGWMHGAGGLDLRAPFISELVVTVDGRLKEGTIERYERDHREAVPGPFGPRSGLGVSMPGGKLMPSPAAPGAPYPVRFENAYGKIWATRSKFSPALRVAFTPYATHSESPERLEAMIDAVSAELLGAERARRISRAGVALDLKSLGFEAPATEDVITRARAVTRTHLPHLATPIFGSVSGGTRFAMFDPNMLAVPEERAWPGRTDGENPRDGFRVWRAELVFHRPAIRGLGLGGPGTARTGQETIPALSGSLDVLLQGALGDGKERPWVRVAAAGTAEVAPSERPDAWWWEAVREAFLAGIAPRPRAAINPKAAPVLRGWRRLLGGVASRA